MANRRSVISVPIWVRVPLIIAVVLVGVVVGAMLLDTTDVGGSHGRSGDETRTDSGGHGPGNHDSGNRDRDGTGHGSGDETQMRDHDQGRAGQAPAPAAVPSDVAARVVTFALEGTVSVPVEEIVHRGGRT